MYNKLVMRKINNPFLNYENKWVAISSDSKEVLAAADSVKQLEKKAKRLKAKVVFTWVPPFDQHLAPYGV